jgi:hypothetical protein
LSLCVFAAGCGDDLAMKDQNRIYRAFGGVAYACTPGVKPTHWQIRQARAGVRAIVAQYRETPDGRAQIGEGSDGIRSMRDTLRDVARSYPREAAACSPIHRAAARALRESD